MVWRIGQVKSCKCEVAIIFQVCRLSHLSSLFLKGWPSRQFVIPFSLSRWYLSREISSFSMSLYPQFFAVACGFVFRLQPVVALRPVMIKWGPQKINIRQWLTKTARECSCSKILKWSLFNGLHLDFQNMKSSLLNSHYVKLVPRKGRCVSIKILIFMSTLADANKGWKSGKEKELTRNQWDLKVNTRKLHEVRKNVSN